MHYAGKALVIQVTPFQDSSIITKLFTPEFGVLSFIVKGIHSKSKTSTPKYLYFQVGAFIQIEFEYQPLKNIQNIRSVQWHLLYKSTYHEVIKMAILMYITEVLLKVLVQPDKNDDLFQFVEDTLILLDSLPSTETNNIPLFFLTQLSKFLGISIHASEIKPDYLGHDSHHLQESQNPYLTNSTADLILLKLLVSQTTYKGYEAMGLNTTMRRQYLNYLHHFYASHGKQLHPLKSITVMQSVL